MAAIVGANGALLLIGLCALELMFGHWLERDRMHRLNLLRSYEGHFSVGDMYARTDPVTYKRDQYGLRGQYKSIAAIDVLTIGGSTTDQRYISEGETWQDVMAGEFAAEGLTVSVVNAGVDGQSTIGHIRNFDWWFPELPGLSARFMLLYVGINDLYVEPDGSSYDVLSTIPEDRAESLSDRVKGDSAIIGAMRDIKGTLAARYLYHVDHHSIDLGTTPWTDQPLLAHHASLMRSSLRAYADRLRILGSRIANRNASVIFVTQPRADYRIAGGRIVGTAAQTRIASFTVNGVDSYYFMRLINKETLRVCRELSAICIDLARKLRFDAGDFYDPVHTTPAGSRKIGSYLYRTLRNRISDGDQHRIS